jgi:hypothetical protein
MNGLTTAQFRLACRTFLTLAYPGGEKAIPEKKRRYLHIPPDADLAALLPPAAAAQGVGQVIKGEDGAVRGYTFRLGSAAFAHLKLQVTGYDHDTCVFAVDTHDSFPRAGRGTPAVGDAEYELWTALQKANRQLKERIERAWEQEGLWTFNKLLRLDVGAPAPDLGDGVAG